MFCSNCGKQIDDKAAICIHCGVPTPNYKSPTGSGFHVMDIPEGRFDWLTTLLLCFFLGALGVHSFYTKKTAIGVAQLLTLGGCGIWALVDLIMIIVGSFKDGNGNTLYRK
ncbi:MAG: TM2 domain-containing protein [Chitinophagaceae bacterium]|jgi:hypothetical protein|nr:TM2 domain-containing protein [Chitinophagaceae bacterium]MCA6495251.1 TM2 domain-containing protein [Chitinophagaceae bacterium]MCA6514131.1 TM2 domain-containing protein [Chitinophagaceae bacterium]MCE2973377.1 TM2 domain-containing protein [Sediminibacterium sp.]